MTSTIDYALMAGDAYFLTRSEKTQFPAWDVAA